MKLCWISAFILLFTTQSFAHKRCDKRNVKKTILKIFEVVETGKSFELANYVVYRGEEESRKWKDHCNYKAPNEKHQIQNLHQKIVDRYIPYKYEFVKFTSQKESEGEWLVWEMNFYTGDKEPKKVYFAFLKVNGNYLLGDID